MSEIFPGAWQVRQLYGNDAATAFWRAVAPSDYEESVIEEGPFSASPSDSDVVRQTDRSHRMRHARVGNAGSKVQRLHNATKPNTATTSDNASTSRAPP